MTKHACLLLALAVTPSAFAETDRKIVSGIVCQAEHPDDRAHLHYFARGVQARGKDVKINCPILRDSTLSAMKFMDIRYQRAFDVGDKQAFSGIFTGELFSCSDVANSSICKGVKFTSNVKNKDEFFASAVPDDADLTRDLPHDDNRVFVYKTVLPKGTLLKSIRYTEKVN